MTWFVFILYLKSKVQRKVRETSPVHMSSDVAGKPLLETILPGGQGRHLSTGDSSGL